MESGNKPVSQSPHCHNMCRFLPVFFDLSPKTVDIYHDGIVIYGDAGAPDLFVDHVLREDLSGMIEEEKKKRRFMGRQDQFFAFLIKAHGGIIIDEGATSSF